MKRFQTIVTSIAVAITGSICLNSGAARTATFTLTRDNNPNDLISNLLGNTTGLSGFSLQTIGNGEGFGLFKNDPFGLTSGVVLSTGKVTNLPGTNKCYITCTDVSTDFPPNRTGGDTLQLRMQFDADNTAADKLYFQYVFGSEELPEWAGSPQYNDPLLVQLNGEELAYLSDGVTPVTITNLARSSDLILNPPNTGPASSETKLDGFSKPLLFAGDLKKGKTNTLLITVQDTGDGIYDSAVFIKAGTLGTVRPPDLASGSVSCSPIPIIGGPSGVVRGSSTGVPGGDTGTTNCTFDTGGTGGTSTSVPEPSSVVGLLAFSFFGTGLLLKKQWKKRGSLSS